MLQRPDLLVVRPQDGGQVARGVGQPVQLDLAPPQLPTEDAVLLRQFLFVEWAESTRRDDVAVIQNEAKRQGLLHFCIGEFQSSVLQIIYSGLQSSWQHIWSANTRSINWYEQFFSKS